MGTVKDYEGDVYKTVVIGKQTWMAENSRSTHLANGEAIPDVTSATVWIPVYPGYGAQQRWRI